MSRPFDDRETQDPAVREADLFAQLPAQLAEAVVAAPGWAEILAGHDLASIRDRAALARLPVTRKSTLVERQRAHPPFGGLAVPDPGLWGRLFLSPGPIFEPQGPGPDPWGGARALYAAGIRKGDIVHNAFAYHLTPGGFILDEAARALGCAVIPAGVGNTEAQLDAIAALKPVAYCGTPDFLKVLLDKGEELGRDMSSIVRAVVSGAALPKSLSAEFARRGIAAFQAYATAELGILAFETSGRSGLVVNEDIILEIVRPGTGDPVAPGEVGEVVVTRMSPAYPLVRFGTGDLSALLPGPSPCGRTNLRLEGWMGRADQRTKVKGMFVDPAQVDQVVKRHPEVRRARLVVGRADEQDTMTLRFEAAVDGEAGATLAEAVAATLRDVTKLSGTAEPVPAGTLANDGKVIDDTRPVG
ncbi:AMP-binding protein [Pseudoxanthobacter sp. M-2]|uniref:phenylacetate--CoA ligase family protein n=1 Tax=Pseudoxanthobacter sp. M-2 TaxID=3078754 RepID=UPI0038FC9EDE